MWSNVFTCLLHRGLWIFVVWASSVYCWQSDKNDVDAAQLKNYNYVASIQNRFGEHKCGGIILTTSKVVTTCLCANKITKHEMRIVASTSHVNPVTPQYQVRLVKDVKKHTSCNTDTDFVVYDVALVDVKYSFVFSQFLNVFPTFYRYKFNTRNEEIFNNGGEIHFQFIIRSTSRCDLVGFGLDRLNNSAVPKNARLNKAEVILLGNDACDTEMRSCCNIVESKAGKIKPKGKACTTTATSRGCSGDEGAALICENQVWALLTKTIECGKSPTLYQNLHYGLPLWKDYITLASLARMNKHDKAK